MSVLRPVSHAGTTHSLIRDETGGECYGGNGRSSNRAASFNPSGYEELGVMSTAGRGLRGWMDHDARREGGAERGAILRLRSV